MEDVIAFLQAIQDSLDVFFKCFVPLRDGYKQFEVQMDIARWRTSDEMPSRVETARDPRELRAPCSTGAPRRAASRRRSRARSPSS